jgi:hypothetical protein
MLDTLRWKCRCLPLIPGSGSSQHSESSYRHEDVRTIGVLKKVSADFPKEGRPGLYTSCGILMHSNQVAMDEA